MVRENYKVERIEVCGFVRYALVKRRGSGIPKQTIAFYADKNEADRNAAERNRLVLTAAK